MKLIIVAAGFCGLALAAVYGGVVYGMADYSMNDKTAGINAIGLQYKKIPALNIPIISGGSLKGYVTVTIVFTGDAETMANLFIPPEAFVRDETFRLIYNDEKINFINLSKYNVDLLLANIKKNVNDRLGAPIVNEVLLENINFIDKADMSVKKPS